MPCMLDRSHLQLVYQYRNWKEWIVLVVTIHDDGKHLAFRLGANGVDLRKSKGSSEDTRTSLCLKRDLSFGCTANFWDGRY